MAILTLRRGRMNLPKSAQVPNCLETHRAEDGHLSFPVCGDIARRLVEHIPDLEIDQPILDLFEKEAEFQRELSDIANSPDLPGNPRLFPFQRVGVRWLLKRKRAVLADAFGLGKSVESLVALDEAKPTRAVVICTNAKCGEWRDHVEEWTSLSATVVSGEASARRDAISAWTHGVLVMNYETAVSHYKDLAKADVVIVDEAHKPRNRKTDWFKNVKKGIAKVPYVFLLTATPEVNGTDDLWTLLNICDPKRFSSYWSFVFRFCEVVNNPFGLEVGSIRDEERDNLERLLSVYVLCRDESYMPGFPELDRKLIICPPRGAQKELYRQMESDWECTYLGRKVEADARLAWMTRLRQLAIHPGLIFPGYDGPSKLDDLVEYVRSGDSKVVAFTMYAELVPLFMERMDVEGIVATYVRGGMKPKEQEERLDHFKRGNAEVILLTHGSGGEGLNLVEAGRFAMIDLAWHPAGNRHAEKRVCRHGQSRPVVEGAILFAEGTVEDHVYDIVARKGENVTLDKIARRMQCPTTKP